VQPYLPALPGFSKQAHALQFALLGRNLAPAGSADHELARLPKKIEESLQLLLYRDLVAWGFFRRIFFGWSAASLLNCGIS
jgi:hypothetical protein